MAVYAFSDVHGNYNLWKQIKEYLKEDDICYCLGDCNDRGEDGIKIIQEVLDTKNIIYLLGNHEQMLIEILEKPFLDEIDKELLHYNGGLGTFYKARALPQDQYNNLLSNLKKLSSCGIYVNNSGKTVFLCHSGCDLQKNIDFTNVNSFIWNRYHISTEQWSNEYNNWVVVHGHTPVQYLNDYMFEKSDKSNVYTYCDGHKIDIDMGSFESKKIALLNLDTFESIYFFDN